MPSHPFLVIMIFHAPKMNQYFSFFLVAVDGFLLGPFYSTEMPPVNALHAWVQGERYREFSARAWNHAEGSPGYSFPECSKRKHPIPVDLDDG